ncbi:MAG: hypothetical protein ACT4PZ_07595 [Panacagrimonas sp.]
MSESPHEPAKRGVPAKQVVVVLTSVAYAVACLAVAQLQSKLLGILMLAPLLVWLAVSFVRLPREQWARIAAAEQKQKQTTLGRITRFVQIAVLIYFAAIVLHWLYGRLQPAFN